METLVPCAGASLDPWGLVGRINVEGTRKCFFLFLCRCAAVPAHEAYIALESAALHMYSCGLLVSERFKSFSNY